LLGAGGHGDLPAWRETLEALPAPSPCCAGDRDAPRLGFATADADALEALLLKLHPWRKGPLELGGVFIDTEWRSDWKWDRVSDGLDLEGHSVLDVGCGNGYFGWRMLAAGAECVVGVDPTLVFVMQWLASRHFAGEVHNYVLPLGVEHLPASAPVFDTVFSMGVLYHRRDPVAHLRHLARLCRAGGQIVLETLVLSASGPEQLIPEGRYARMRNVWAIPSLALLEQWLAEAGLENHRLLDVSKTSTDEQRSTAWMRFQSLEQCLDEADPGRTVEGHPAPVRAALLIRAAD
jgi:tRNA (mo5U34)-methyltransferase